MGASAQLVPVPDARPGDLDCSDLWYKNDSLYSPCACSGSQQILNLLVLGNPAARNSSMSKAREEDQLRSVPLFTEIVLHSTYSVGQYFFVTRDRDRLKVRQGRT